MASGSPLSVVFLDAGTVDLGDVDLAPLQRQGRLTFFPDTSPEEVLQRARGAQVLITNKCVLHGSVLDRLSDVKLVCVAATGTDNVDLKAAEERGIAVANVTDYSTPSVVEHTFMFLLAFSHRLLEQHKAALDRVWSASSHFALFDYPFSDLDGKTLGVIGYGTIGKKVASVAKAFGMKVLVARIPGRKYADAKNRLPLEKVLKESDFVTIHCALGPETRSLINTKRLNLMKKSAYLLNLARGPIVNEWAIAEVLQAGRLAGYATDVMEREPPPPDHPFFQDQVRSKVLITPHIAWASRESRQRLIYEIAANIEAFKKGRKRNRVV